MLQFDDIQGILLSSYAHLPCAAYLLYTIDNAEKARQWLALCADEVKNADGKENSYSVNLAITFQGLRKLGLDESTLRTFPIPFRDGMHSKKRSHILGDTNENSPEFWEWGNEHLSVDLLLMVFACDETVIKQQVARMKTRIEETGALSLSKHLAAGRQPDNREHFGFADGVGQPVIEGNDRHLEKQQRRTNHATIVKAGEFILGYVNEYGVPAESPVVSASLDPQKWLPEYDVPEDLRFTRSVDEGKLHDLGRNGSYLVFRHLKQHVARFWNFLDAATRTPDGQRDAEARVRLGAKFVGRWPSGAPLVLSPHEDNPALKEENDFGFAGTDRYGFACPIGSHIRRANPRDSVNKNPDASLNSVRRHRLTRRGRSYGDRLADVMVDDGKDRGLYFICLNADIERQFEFVQQTWINNPVFGDLDNETDPLIGNQDKDLCSGRMTVQNDPVRMRVQNLCSFVTVLGGAYFFLPGIKAIRYLSSLKPGS